jgi:hypothetical protein
MRKSVGRLAALAAAGALTFVGLPVASASAGTNGQNVGFCVHDGAPYAKIVGTNQNGRATIEILPTFQIGFHPVFTCAASDYWWKGTAEIWYSDGVQWYPDHACWVPESMGDDEFYC